uniref:Uncharacterized protein n=1 Tax=Cercocebus atys TaxID=9531 RepID=A0A2K5NHE7_CERAT
MQYIYEAVPSTFMILTSSCVLEVSHSLRSRPVVEMCARYLNFIPHLSPRRSSTPHWQGSAHPLWMSPGLLVLGVMCLLLLPNETV